MPSIRSIGRSPWAVPAGLVLLSIVPAIGGAVRLGDLANGSVTPENARFFAMPLPILLHIFAAIPYGIIGAFQFSAEFRKRHRTWHRISGRVLLLCASIVAISGLWMTLAYPWANHDAEAVYLMRLTVGIAMLYAIIMGIDAIRRRDFNEHGEWMIRSYAIAMGAGTQVLTHIPWFILVGEVGEMSRAILMGSAWAINAVAAEWIIRSGRARRAQASIAARHAAAQHRAQKQGIHAG